MRAFRGLHRESIHYPVGGLSPLSPGRHQGFSRDAPDPEDFEVVDGDVGLGRKGPVETDRQQAVLTHRDVRGSQSGRGRRRRRVWTQKHSYKRTEDIKPQGSATTSGRVNVNKHLTERLIKLTFLSNIYRSHIICQCEWTVALFIYY